MAMLSRRDMLKLGVLGTAAATLPFERGATAANGVSRIAESRLPAPFTVPFASPPVARPVWRATDDGYDFYEIKQQATQAEVLPGYKSDLWAYNGVPAGPTIKVRRGRPAVVRQINNLPGRHPTLGYQVMTSTHLHGSGSLPQYDGYANDVTGPGQWKDYHYPNHQDARTLWYHDHGLHHTAENAYMGLAAMYIMTDELEQGLPIPHGDYDVPLIIQDTMFDERGSMIYDDHGHSGLYGDVILVNGRPWPVMKVERRKYRFRFLNASLSRGYTFRLSTGDPFWIIGTDGGLMQFPQRTTTFRQSMAERYEVVIDFATYRTGERIVLENLGVQNAVDYDGTRNVMAFDVVGDATDLRGNAIPDLLNPKPPAMDLVETPNLRTRRFEFVRADGQWAINGKTWHDAADSGYEYVWADPGLNDTEIWEFVNTSGGWFHPVHVHLIDFKILDRNGKPPFDYELGPKDTVYVGENETVRVIARFGPHQGKYMIHCHNLVHEDHDMMAQFRVGPPGGGDDPVKAAPCRDLPAPEL
ncbi:multicopper oxidase family protein [Micromonospora sp. NPDC047740]|uniref:multicopper oxidase family protein n=1 Tax=Micromonospora sp. NPDC047740 TaxID=3364254 RepID=UPI0037137493